MQSLYEWFATVLHLDRGSQSRSASGPNMANADDGEDMNIDQEGELVDYGDSSLDLPEPSEEPAQDGAVIQSTPAQVQAQSRDEQSVPSQGTAHPTHHTPSPAVGNLSNVPSTSQSPGSYAGAPRSGAQFDDIRKEQAAARRERQNIAEHFRPYWQECLRLRHVPQLPIHLQELPSWEHCPSTLVKLIPSSYRTGSCKCRHNAAYNL